ncbi:MAG: hypothetical protein KA335_05165 [Ramlibacter sp.]|jgi:hypothetical protein|nr:hypothetical protein [Ramlibacter sp.]
MHQPLAGIQAALDTLRVGGIGVQAFSTQVRSQAGLLAQLPARYGQVLDDLLDRLESSALFSEESCSFSRDGLLDNLQLWIDKARGQLDKT